jgi:hypothetical protein
VLKGAFTDQFFGRLRKPTFSTQSAYCWLSRRAATSQRLLRTHVY